MNQQIKPIIINEELTKRKVNDSGDCERNILLINNGIRNALLAKRNCIDIQMSVDKHESIEMILSGYKEQEGTTVELLKVNEIPTVTSKIFIVDVKISW